MAIYHLFSNGIHMLNVADKRKHIQCLPNGKSTFSSGANWADIVSEWKEPIDEEKTIDKACEWLEKELKKLSMKEIKEDFLSNEFKVILETDIPKWIDDFRKFMDGKQ